MYEQCSFSLTRARGLYNSPLQNKHWALKSLFTFFCKSEIFFRISFSQRKQVICISFVRMKWHKANFWKAGDTCRPNIQLGQERTLAPNEIPLEWSLRYVFWGAKMSMWKRHWCSLPISSRSLSFKVLSLLFPHLNAVRKFISRIRVSCRWYRKVLQNALWSKRANSGETPWEID